MIMSILAACALIVVRSCWIAFARCILSSLFSPVTFLRYSFASFGARCTLIALHCSNFADNGLLFAGPFLQFGCLLPAVRFLFLAAKLSFLVTDPLGARCELLIALCSLLLTRFSPPNCRFCLFASSRLLITARPRGLFIAARALLFASPRVNFLTQ